MLQHFFFLLDSTSVFFLILNNAILCIQDGLDGGGFCHSIVVPVLERCLDT